MRGSPRGSRARSRGGGRGRMCGGCWRRWTGRTGGRWRSQLGESGPGGCSGCCTARTGTPTGPRRPGRLRPRAPGEGTGGGADRRRDRLPQEGHQVGRGPTPVLRHRRADRELPDRRLPGLRQRRGAGVAGSGAVPARGVDRRPGPCGERPGSPKRSRSPPSRSWPSGCRRMDAGVTSDWVTGDAVYGNDVRFRGPWSRTGSRTSWRSDATSGSAGGGETGSTPSSSGCRPRPGAVQRRGRLERPAVVRLGGRVVRGVADGRGSGCWSAAHHRRRQERAYYLCRGPADTQLRSWSGSPGPAGRSRSPSSPPRGRAAWISTRSAAGSAGIDTSPWRCSPPPSS